MKQFRCVAIFKMVPGQTQFVNHIKEAAHTLGIKHARLWRLLNPEKPAIPFTEARQEYLLIAGYLRCSVHDLFEPIEPTIIP
jgi:hypothetical protein